MFGWQLRVETAAWRHYTLHNDASLYKNFRTGKEVWYHKTWDKTAVNYKDWNFAFLLRIVADKFCIFIWKLTVNEAENLQSRTKVFAEGATFLHFAAVLQSWDLEYCVGEILRHQMYWNLVKRVCILWRPHSQSEWEFSSVEDNFNQKLSVSLIALGLEQMIPCSDQRSSSRQSAGLSAVRASTADQKNPTGRGQIGPDSPTSILMPELYRWWSPDTAHSLSNVKLICQQCNGYFHK